MFETFEIRSFILKLKLTVKYIWVLIGFCHAHEAIKHSSESLGIWHCLEFCLPKQKYYHNLPALISRRQQHWNKKHTEKKQRDIFLLNGWHKIWLKTGNRSYQLFLIKRYIELFDHISIAIRISLYNEFQRIVFYTLDYLKVKMKTFHLKTTIKYRFPRQPYSVYALKRTMVISAHKMLFSARM